jgi:hypothetical protein
LTALKESGLSRIQNPDGTARSNGPSPKHNVAIYASSSAENIMANIIYDFILAHYNQAANSNSGDVQLKACIKDISFPDKCQR